MGRPKGSSNKIGAELKEHFLKAFHTLQVDDKKDFHLVEWAKSNPKDFYSITSKLFPTEINHGGQEDNPINHNVEVSIVTNSNRNSRSL